jgi:hypothetical protein
MTRTEAANQLPLNLPLFAPGEGPYRGSIEGGYAAMARFFSQHPNPWGWNPTQYCGLPSQFTYVPVMPYLAAGASWAVRSLPVEYIYRIVASTFACLGPASLFLFVLYFTRSRWWALSAAIVYTFFSPVYSLIHTIDLDRGSAYLPWRLQVLVKYGEGPHNAGLTLIPLALAAVWECGVGRGFRRVVAAAALLAVVALTNWVAALALAFCCLVLLATLAGSFPVTGFRARRVFAAAGLGYGLACFWLTPSFIRTIAFNWPEDGFGYRLNWPQIFLLFGMPLALLVARVLLARLLPGRYYLWFVTLSLAGFAWIVLWFDLRGMNTIPESRRYALEMEMFLTLAMVEWVRLASRALIAPFKYFAIYVAFAVFLSAWGQGQMRRYCIQGFAARQPVPRENTIEYRLAERLSALRPAGRVFVSGGLRFRLNSWFDIPQVGGGFESGLKNRTPLRLSDRIRAGEDPVRALETLGAEFVVVDGPHSREYYRDFKNPREFDGVLEAVWREEDDTIYRVPFSRLAGAGLDVSWHGAGDLWLEGPLPEAQSVSVKVNYDPGWRAEQDGRQIAIERDGLGFMLLRANASPMARIHLRYRGTLEQYSMGALSAIAWIVGLVRFVRAS